MRMIGMMDYDHAHRSDRNIPLASLRKRRGIPRCARNDIRAAGIPRSLAALVRAPFVARKGQQARRREWL